MTLHKEGTASIIIVLLVAGAIMGLSYSLAADYPIVIALGWLVSLFLVIIILQFFRAPSRPVSPEEGVVLCPADGKVVVIEEVTETEFFEDKRIQVSIFMSPINVHINWAPVSGLIKYVKYHPGKYLVAWHPKSSTENERTTIVLETANQTEVLIRQIAGALARRIVHYAEEGKKVVQGGQVGFIKFGSRVDVFLPIGTEIKVTLDQKVKGNVTQLAQLKKD
ncbi:MAG: phosphatidylserine decarboxylase family protein [Salibacteraceae bacterium]